MVVGCLLIIGLLFLVMSEANVKEKLIGILKELLPKRTQPLPPSIRAFWQCAPLLAALTLYYNNIYSRDETDADVLKLYDLELITEEKH